MKFLLKLFILSCLILNQAKAQTPISQQPAVSVNTSITTITNAPLAIELVSFHVHQKNDIVVINWITTTEDPTDHFDVERSENSTTWNSIGTISQTSKVENNHRYSYIFQDNKVLEGMIFYRLRSVSVDGTFKYSKIVSISITKNEKIAFYPNPTNGVILIKGKIAGSIEVFDYTGKMIMQSKDNASSLDISNLIPGMYVFRFESEGEMMSKQIIKY